MNRSYIRRPAGRLLFAIFLLTALLLIAACQPIVDPALLEAQSGASSTEAVFEVEPAKATIDAASLRVRQGPSDDYELVAGVNEGESYEVLAMTSDGAWIQLAVEEAPDGQGWVSTEFVTLEGDITNIATVPAEGAEEDAAAETESDDAAVAETEQTESQGGTALAPVGEALIQTPLPLRVRSEPDDTVDNKIGSVYNLEKYPVLDISEDGQWVQIDVPRLSDSGGWVWWENVVISGEIADRFAELTGGSTEDGADASAEAEPAPAETEAPADATADTDSTEAAPAEASATEEPAQEAAEGATAEATEEPAAEPETEDVAVDAIGEALIQTPLPLRVRSEPTDAVDNKIGNVFNGETYPVLEISEDGLWVKLHVPELADDGGWVSAEYVVLDQ